MAKRESMKASGGTFEVVQGAIKNQHAESGGIVMVLQPSKISGATKGSPLIATEWTYSRRAAFLGGP